MSSFLIESFKGGISEYEDKGIKGAFKFGRGLDIRRNRDTLKAQQGLTDDLATGTLDARVRFIVPSSDGNSYVFLANGKIYKRTSVGAYSLVYTDADAEITGAAEWVNDNSETGMYWATGTKLRRKPIPGQANWSDVDASAGNPAQTYPKTNLTDTDWHTMMPINGMLLGCNANTLFTVGYDESYSNNALQLIPGNIAKTLLDHGLYAVVGANRSDDAEQSSLYLWDTLADNYLDRQRLPFADINALVETELIIVQFGTDGKLYFYGNGTKVPVMSFPNGGKVDPGGVDVDGNLALFGVYSNGSSYTGVYTYGRKKRNADLVLNLDYPLDVDEINCVKKVGSDILIAYKDDSTYGIKKVDTSNKITKARYESIDLKMPPEFQDRAIVPYVQLTMAPLPSGTSIEVWRRRDKVGTGGTDYAGTSTGNNDGWFQCMTPDGSGTYNTANGIEAVFSLEDQVRIMEVAVILNCSGNNSPEVFRIQPFLENVR